jgi:RNA polymerase sigma-70 factor, ECF subfamily
MLHFLSPERRSVDQLRKGELEGLRWIYDNHSERLLNQGYRILLSREQAEDMVQDLFIRLPGIIADFRRECSLSTWLFRVAHNMCLNRLQQAKNHFKLEVENLEEITPRNSMASFEVTDFLDKALAILDAETRSLLWLKEGEGVPLKELSLIFKLPEGTLKSKLSRARERVREKMENMEKESSVEKS